MSTSRPSPTSVPPILPTDTVDDAFPMPPEITYQETKEKIIRDKRSIELLSAYTKRENKIALTGRLLDEQRNKRERKEQA